jgi:hypothetical protein
MVVTFHCKAFFDSRPKFQFGTEPYIQNRRSIFKASALVRVTQQTLDFSRFAEISVEMSTLLHQSYEGRLTGEVDRNIVCHTSLTI